MLAKTLFGDANKWGKMPYTVYTKNYTEEVKLDDYDMTVSAHKKRTALSNQRCRFPNNLLWRAAPLP